MPKGVYARHQVNSDDIAIEQKDDITCEPEERAPEIVRADASLKASDFDELKFNEEPVTINLGASGAENAPTSILVSVNGKGIEVMQNGQWLEFKYAPIGATFTTKRKYLAVLLGAKVDKINTICPTTDQIVNGSAVNRERRVTQGVASVSLIRDDNPKGPAWFSEMIRRNMG